MEISTILILIAILLIDVVLIIKDIKNKLIFKGTRKFRIVIPVMIIAFIIITLSTNKFRAQDIIMCIEIMPLVFVGNKTGITEKGFLFNSYVTPWDKVESYSLDDQDNKYVVTYKTNIGSRLISFKQEDKDEVKKHLLSINKLRYARK